MQESQRIQREKTSELEILYKQIPQIQLEFSAQLKQESEAKDQEVSLFPFFLIRGREKYGGSLLILYYW